MDDRQAMALPPLPSSHQVPEGAAASALPSMWAAGGAELPGRGSGRQEPSAHRSDLASRAVCFQWSHRPSSLASSGKLTRTLRS